MTETGGSGMTDKTFFQRKGYLPIKAVFSPTEMKEIRAECDRLLGPEGGLPSALREGFRRKNKGGELVRNLVDPVLPHSTIFRDLSQNEKILTPIRNLLGDEPSLFKDKLILKPAGVSGYGVHQDYAYYGWTGAGPDQIVSVQLAIDEADESNGALCVFPGMHNRLYDSGYKSGRDISLDQLPMTDSDLVKTSRGDLLILHGLVPHWSDKNHSDYGRRTLYLTYNAVSAGNLYPVYYQQRGGIVS